MPEQTGALSDDAAPLVLVVDDDPTIRVLMRETLEQEGFIVKDVATGIDALEAMGAGGNRQPDIILLDALMPGMDGFDVLNEMHRRRNAPPPVVMVTTLEDTESVQRAYAAGATDFITKPIHWPNLPNRVRYLLRAHRAIEEREQVAENLLLAREVFENSDELIAVTDLNADIIDANPAFLRLTGYDREELIGKNLRLLKFESHDHPFYEHYEGALREEGCWQGEIRGSCKDGEEFTCLMTINAVQGDQGVPTRFVSLSTDVTRLKKVEEQLRHLAFFDSLTALPNRDLLRDRLQQAVYEARRDGTELALLFLDLDNFRDINDTLGHPIGDIVLAQAACRLKEHTRHSDTIARMGGDEFVIVARNITGAEIASRVAGGMLEDLAAPFFLDGRKIYVTLSIGIALFPADGDKTDELIKKAETAMYQAKEQGKNRYTFYSEEMNACAQERLALQADLRLALERDEFVLHYQPKINLLTGETTGVEALLRWQKPETGLVYPASFIPLAEETGMIVPIGARVMQMACAQIKSWEAEGLPPLPAAVNLSAIQLREDRLAAAVDSILRETELAPRLLELEITESAIIQNSEKAVSLLQAMKKMGIRLTMDDFGTGYSSLSYLKRFPISGLKIDRSFIGELLTNGGDAVIVSAIIAMAHHLQLKVVAEGVNSVEQLDFLRREGCDEAQGYFIAPPMSAADFAFWYRERASSGT